MSNKRLHFLTYNRILYCLYMPAFYHGGHLFRQKRNSLFWHQVQEGEYIDILVLGNSHAYMSTDTLLFSSVTGMNVQLFSSSSPNMEETLIHLEQALKYNSPKYIFLEVNST